MVIVKKRWSLFEHRRCTEGAREVRGRWEGGGKEGRLREYHDQIGASLVNFKECIQTSQSRVYREDHPTG